MSLKPRIVSVAVLTVLGSAILLLSFDSARLAYSGADYNVGPAKVKDLAAGRDGVESALRGMRATAAAYAAAFAVLFLGTVLVPYRRGDAWAFWVLLASVLAFAMISLARTLLLGTWLGVGAALVQAGIALAALVFGRFETSPQPSAAAPPSPPASAPQ